jgi:hypothetical protein
VFESADPESREQNATDKRFFWMALYVQPVLWVVLAIFALIGLKFIWLTLVGKSMDGKAKEIWIAGFEDIRLIPCSHCARPYDYEYPCFLEMRQV